MADGGLRVGEGRGRSVTSFALSLWPDEHDMTRHGRVGLGRKGGLTECNFNSDALEL